MKKLLFSIGIPLSVVLLASCGGGGGVGSGEPSLPLTNLVVEDARPETVFLRITDVVEEDTAYIYHVRALDGSDTLGMLVSVDREIEAGIAEDGLPKKTGFREGTIKFLSAGEESDKFVQRLAELWNVDLDSLGSNKFSNAPIVPLAFSSSKKPVDQTSPTTNNFKLFFELNSERPGEIFFTLDLYKKGIQFQEKDASHRQQIIKGFLGSTKADDTEG